jgi:hypothetical protein
MIPGWTAEAVGLPLDPHPSPDAVYAYSDPSDAPGGMPVGESVSLTLAGAAVLVEGNGLALRVSVTASDIFGFALVDYTQSTVAGWGVCTARSLSTWAGLTRLSAEWSR